MPSRSLRRKTRVSVGARQRRAAHYRVSQATFKRQDVEWILWRILSNSPAAPIRKAFSARMKALLHIDRVGKFRGHASTVENYAFRATLPLGPGSDARYTLLDVYCLWMGMQFSDMGFKPSPVVLFLRGARHRIARQLGKILYQQRVFLTLTRLELGTVLGPPEPCKGDGFDDFRILRGAQSKRELMNKMGTARCIALQLDTGLRRLVAELDGVLRRAAGPAL
jgi:hypothetical protein